MNNPDKNTLAIVCGGGPAPGINSVISSVTIVARKHGWEVYGIYDGFANLGRGEKKFVPLDLENVSRIHSEGGSILRMSRFNPTRSEATLKKVADTLVSMGVTHLVSIGGDDTAYSASQVAEYATNTLGLSLSFVHVPKTIDNDLPLPEGIPTFGYETARAMGARVVANLMDDAMTTGRWYIVVAMGRSAGHLALGIGKSAAATLTIIPEDFPVKEKIPLRLLADIIVGAMIKRLAEGRGHGVAVLAEGLLDRIRTEDLEHLGCVDRDDHGHVRYGEIDFASIIKKEVQTVLDELNITMPITTKDVGYELRCAPPIAYDVDYTRNLGYAAFEFLRNGGSNAMITIQNNAIVPVSFKDIEDPVTKKTRVRLVNTDSVSYKIARQYMIRLDPDDFDQGIEFDQIALASNLSKEEFKKRFQYVTKY